MKLVYIAGAFRAPTAWEVEQNCRKAEQLALEVWRLGAACICPHTNTRHFDGAAPDSLWLKGDLEILKRCDAVLMVPNWNDSEGARQEHDEALARQIPVFYSLDRLETWLKEKTWQHLKAVGLQWAAHINSGELVQIATVNHNDGFGHGHVRPRPDGVKARCGGPGLCRQCARELSAKVELRDWKQWADLHDQARQPRTADCWPPVWVHK